MVVFEKRFLRWMLFVLFIAFLPLLLKDPIGKRTGRFTVWAISFENSKRADALSSSYPEEIVHLFDDQLVYLGSGTQFCAFTTPCGKYVIKFLKTTHFQLPFWVDLLGYLKPLNHFYQRKREERAAKKELVLKGCRLAYEGIVSKSCILYMQLEEGPFSKEISLLDKIGHSYKINLQNTRFIVQKRAELLEKAFLNQEEGKRIIDSFVDRVTERCRKGISNKDANLMKNFGWVDSEVLEIDFGEFEEDPSVLTVAGYRIEIERYVKKFDKWALKEAPDLSRYFHAKVEEAIANYGS